MSKALAKGVLPFLVFTAVGFGIFLAFGQGALLICSVERSQSADFPDCYLRKRTLFKSEEEKFSRFGIQAVELSVATHKTQRSKTSEDYWTVRLRSGNAIELTLRGVAWPRGNLDLKSARALLLAQNNNQVPLRELHLVSYGLLPWFLGLLSGSIGWVLLLVAMAKPVTDVSPDELRRARTANFTMLVLVTGSTVGGWLLFFRLFEKFLAA